MLDSVTSMINQIRQDKQYALDVDSMNAYFSAYGFDKDTLAFNLLFPPSIDLRYVQ
jgi:hypothetical protein